MVQNILLLGDHKSPWHAVHTGHMEFGLFPPTISTAAHSVNFLRLKVSHGLVQDVIFRVLRSGPHVWVIHVQPVLSSPSWRLTKFDIWHLPTQSAASLIEFVDGGVDCSLSLELAIAFIEE